MVAIETATPDGHSFSPRFVSGIDSSVLPLLAVHGGAPHVDTVLGQQSRQPLQKPGQDGGVGAARRGEGVRSGAYVDTVHDQQFWYPLLQQGQDGGVGAARRGEGVRSGAYVDTIHDQQFWYPLLQPGQDGRG